MHCLGGKKNEEQGKEEREVDCEKESVQHGKGNGRKEETRNEWTIGKNERANPAYIHRKGQRWGEEGRVLARAPQDGKR